MYRMNLLKLTIIIMIVSSVFISCDNKTTGTTSGDLTGYVILVPDEGEEEVLDFSSISVALYKPVVLDTTITRLNRDYPHIGVHISQETEFDHRLQNPMYTTETNSSGYFQLKNIPVGVYNLVAYKQGWGFMYKCNLQLSDGIYEISTNSNPIKLYTAIKISNPVLGDLILDTDRHYIIETNTDFHPSSYLTIKPGTILRVNPGVTVSIYGSLKIESSYGMHFRVTSNDGFYPLSNNINNYSSFSVKSSANLEDNLISYGIFNFSNYGLIVEKNNIEVTNSIFVGSNAGCTFEQVSNFTVSKTIFRNTLLTGQPSLYVSYAQDGVIQNSIFVNNSIGIKLVASNNNEISNCFFIDNYQTAIYNWFESDNKVQYSTIYRGEIGLVNNARSSLVVLYSEIGTEIGLFNTTERVDWAIPTMNYNNFNCSDFAVKTHARFITYQGIRYLDTTNNYWGTVNIQEIEDLIWDRFDEDETNGWYPNLLGVFVYDPFLYHPYADAGIQRD